METRRRQDTVAFKRDAVALVMEGYPLALAAQNLGITAQLLSRWKREQQQHEAAAFPGQGHQTPDRPDLRQRGQSDPPRKIHPRLSTREIRRVKPQPGQFVPDFAG